MASMSSVSTNREQALDGGEPTLKTTFLDATGGRMKFRQERTYQL
jgi:hypothetical protein